METLHSFRIGTPADARHLLACLVDRLEPGATMVVLLDEARWYLHGFVPGPSLTIPAAIDAAAGGLRPGDAIMLVSNRTGEVPADRPDDELVWEELVGTALAHGVVLVDWWVLCGTQAFSIAEHAPTAPAYDGDEVECECCRLEAEAEGALADLDRWRFDYLGRVHGQVRDHGFSIQAVGGGDDGASWAYTIGFLELGHPEVIVFGLDVQSAGEALHVLHREIVDGARRPIGIEHVQSLGDGDDGVRLLPVPDSAWWDDANRLAVAAAYYSALGWEREQLRAVQLVWAAPGGHFPWEPECSPRFRHVQPILDPEVRDGS